MSFQKQLDAAAIDVIPVAEELEPTKGMVSASVAPEPQDFARTDLTNVEGVVIRQETQFLESFAAGMGLPYEGKNKYKLGALPKGKNVGGSPTWTPTDKELVASEPLLQIQEESDVCERMVLNFLGIGNLRNLKLHYYNQQGKDEIVQERPCNLTASCCCPSVSTMYSVDANGSPQPVGKVVEDCAPCSAQYVTRCFQKTCCCKSYYKAYRADSTGTFTEKYDLEYNLACFGHRNNCFGATCCCPNMVFRVTDPHTGEQVASVQKTFGTANSGGGLCRMFCQFSNYLVSFPEKDSHEDRALLVGSVLHAEYLLFEKDGDEN